jgi:Predicted ATP-dependent endonuclease of the OLD family
MKLINFSVTNFRSVTAAHRIGLSDVTVLIGRNNEGKSNILRALDVAMTLLQRHAELGGRRSRAALGYYSSPYVWKRDFPVQLQGRRRSTQTILRLEFEFSQLEIDEFRSEIGVNLNGLLPLEIKIGKDDEPEIKVVKSGRGSATLAAKSGRIAKFVASKIHFNYIPAVRTDEASIELVSRLLSQELRSLEDDPKYIESLQAIADLQKPILDRVAETLQTPLKEFLPSIKSVRVEISEAGRRGALRRGVDVVVDDGTPTSLEFKGDGVKSLAALGLLKFQNSRAGSSLLAIEEPESHLHPGAIHQVNEIIRSISSKSQIIITTHNPLFVDREDVRSNIIVNDGSAKPARTISAVRDLLGIKASDNLTNANFVLVVEGDEDVIALRGILSALSSKLASALKGNYLVIESIGGAGNLSYKLSLLRSALCATHVLLDGDDAGRRAFEKAEADGLCQISGCTFITCNGMGQAELEDCIDPEIYREAVLNEFGVDLRGSTFRGNSKWSQRVRATFLDQGKQFTDRICSRVKFIVATEISKSAVTALNPHKRNSIDALVAALERMVRL